MDKFALIASPILYVITAIALFAYLLVAKTQPNVMYVYGFVFFNIILGAGLSAGILFSDKTEKKKERSESWWMLSLVILPLVILLTEKISTLKPLNVGTIGPMTGTALDSTMKFPLVFHGAAATVAMMNNLIAIA